jgi:type I restriction enzyme, S subunit
VAKDDKRTVTPRLRFPEFREAGGWVCMPMSDLLSLEYGESLPEKSRRTGPVPVMGSNGIVGYHEEALIKGPAIIVGRKGSVGHVTWIDSDCFPIDTTFYVENKKPSKISIHFLHRLLQVSGLESHRDPGAVPGLNRNEVHSLGTAIPEPAEQQKIADCLTSLDELIATQDRKVEALKVHKKGLMQQLFPREGETLPRLRFPEFRDAPEWQIKPLSRVAENLDNKRVPITEKDRTKGDVPYYGASGVVDHVNGHIFDEDLLCVSEDGANLVARNYPIAFPISGKTWVNNHAHVLRFDDSARQKIVEVYLNAIDLGDFITGMAQPKLNRAMLDTIPIPLPEPAEQQRIADCLSALDARITAEADKLAALKTHKKSLMQQLFPSAEGD